MFFPIALIWVIVFLTWWYIKDHEHEWNLAKKIPGPPGYPLIGNAFLFWGSAEQITRRLSILIRTYTRMIGLWIGTSYKVLLFDPKDIEIVLKSTKNVIKADDYWFWKPFLGEGLLTIPGGNKFKQNKRLIAPSFQLSNLKGFFEVFNVQTTDLIKILKNHTGEEFDVHSIIATYTMNILMETVLGLNKETLEKDAIKYGYAADRLGKIATERMFKFWLRPDIIFNFTNRKKNQDKYLKVVNEIANRVIDERRKNNNNNTNKHDFNANNKNWSVFLDSLLSAKDDDGVPLSNNNIKDEVITFLFAGQDTTTSSICFALCLLGLYKDIQKNVYDEVISVTGNDPNSYIGYEEVKNMEYLDRVIQETWRLYPPAPVVAKKTTEDVRLENCVLPKNTTIAIMIFFLHRNADIYPNPYTFNPDNFLPEKVNRRHPCSFIPFSAGYRTCVGQKYAHLLVKVALASIIRNFQVHSEREEKHFVLSLQTTLKRKDGFRLTLHQRSKNIEQSKI